MVARDLKYLLAYVLPLATIYSIQGEGIRSYSTVIIAFVIIPILELVVPRWKDNFPPEQQEKRSKIIFFEILLFLNILWVFGMLFFFSSQIILHSWSTFEWIGKIFSLGIMLGSNGINVAHELGHKSGKFHQLAAQILLWPCLYTHFTTEHNYGHHVKVGTPEDPATARFGESVYMFWIRSIVCSYKSAWKIKIKQAKSNSFQTQPILSLLIWPLSYPALILLWGNTQLFISLIGAALISILLLETINYIEHYGLTRNRTKHGTYEPVNMMHSWNSNHEVGRVVLYELTRHSDHHYKAYKKYQNLNHFDESPQLPLGYPGSIILSLIPPLWFYIMHPLLSVWRVKMLNYETHY